MLFCLAPPVRGRKFITLSISSLQKGQLRFRRFGPNWDKIPRFAKSYEVVSAQTAKSFGSGDG